jgi:hypothetical protein
MCSVFEIAPSGMCQHALHSVIQIAWQSLGSLVGGRFLPLSMLAAETIAAPARAQAQSAATMTTPNLTAIQYARVPGKSLTSFAGGCGA